MDRIVYLLRNEAERLPEALYGPGNSDALVVALKLNVSTPSVAHVLASGYDSSVTPGTQLSYSELLTLLIGAEKVITL